MGVGVSGGRGRGGGGGGGRRRGGGGVAGWWRERGLLWLMTFVSTKDF